MKFARQKPFPAPGPEGGGAVRVQPRWRLNPNRISEFQDCLPGPRSILVRLRTLVSISKNMETDVELPRGKGGEMGTESEAKEAQWGKRMIEIKVRLWTDSIASGKGVIRPKHAWGAGVVRIDRNTEHGIVPGKALPFNSMAEIPSRIERCLMEHGIKIHLSSRERRYIVSDTS